MKRDRKGEYMPRGKKLVIEKKIADPIIYRIKNLNIKEIEAKRKTVEKNLSATIEQMVREANQLYKQKKLEREKLRSIGLLPIQEAYEELKAGGINLSFRAFGGRVERRTLPSVKVGSRRLIPRPIIKDLISITKEYYTVKEAFNEVAKTEDINFRAFIGRIEKGRIPSLKIGKTRWVPKSAIEGLTHINSNYYDVGEAVAKLQEAGVKIRRNAFERRLDRKRIPYEKIGRRRFIPKEILNELIEKELALTKK
ncbi:MAG: hypothetical protein QXN01_00130 [Candidatus Anstonellales archaeon]